jgi:hypothetical protein
MLEFCNFQTTLGRHFIDSEIIDGTFLNGHETSFLSGASDECHVQLADSARYRAAESSSVM